MTQSEPRRGDRRETNRAVLFPESLRPFTSRQFTPPRDQTIVWLSRRGCSSLFIPWRHSLPPQSLIYFYYSIWDKIRESGASPQNGRLSHTGAGKTPDTRLYDASDNAREILSLTTRKPEKLIESECREIDSGRSCP